MHPRLQSKLALAATILISLGGVSAASAKSCPTLRVPGLMPHPEMLMTAVDANGDGDIARTEATAFHDRMFEQMDTNRDGTIKRREIGERMAPCPLLKTPEFE